MSGNRACERAKIAEDHEVNDFWWGFNMRQLPQQQQQQQQHLFFSYMRQFTVFDFTRR